MVNISLSKWNDYFSRLITKTKIIQKAQWCFKQDSIGRYIYFLSSKSIFQLHILSSFVCDEKSFKQGQSVDIERWCMKREGYEIKRRRWTRNWLHLTLYDMLFLCFFFALSIHIMMMIIIVSNTNKALLRVPLIFLCLISLQNIIIFLW